MTHTNQQWLLCKHCCVKEMAHTVDQLPTFQGRTGQTSQHFHDFIASMWLDHKSQTSRLSACGLLWSCCDIMSGLGQACIMTVDRVHLLILLFHSYFVHFAFMFDFQLRTGEVTGRLIKSFQWILCLFARFVYLYGWPNQQTNCFSCVCYWMSCCILTHPGGGRRELN